MEESYQLIEHLKLIEQQIQRMADNSFKVKNWALTVVGGALLYWLKEETPKDNMIWLWVLIIMATIIFWWLDAYYLALEKCYRELYVDRIHIFSKKHGSDRLGRWDELNFGIMFSHMMVVAEEIWLDVDLIRLEEITQKNFPNNQYVLSAILRP